MEFKNPHFIKTVVDPTDCPILKDDRGVFLPEIALAGRSNVGKSSLLNHLFQKKNLVRTSSTPGKTQALNFFGVDKKLIFVDLPGYGFAKVPLKVKQEWGPLIQGYLENRPTLKALIFLFDIRREPAEEDFQLLEWIKYYKIPMIFVLTKVDKVNQAELQSQTTKILKAFDLTECVHYSVPDNKGRQQLWNQIKKVVRWED